jgi:hypothetical protein
MAQVEEICPNAQQIEYWNATTGDDTWAQFQELLDRQIEPLGPRILRCGRNKNRLCHVC